MTTRGARLLDGGWHDVEIVFDRPAAPLAIRADGSPPVWVKAEGTAATSCTLAIRARAASPARSQRWKWTLILRRRPAKSAEMPHSHQSYHVPIGD